jgi:VanZ family protein
VLYVFLVSLFFEITDELHQYFVSGRKTSLLDVTADGLGFLLGTYFFHGPFDQLNDLDLNSPE